uniref:Uncharacterized protein n=1 Tax=Arion vulgaris TaxID=1028688 RepID=A0A0B7APC6_9EUPU
MTLVVPPLPRVNGSFPVAVLYCFYQEEHSVASCSQEGECQWVDRAKLNRGMLRKAWSTIANHLL